MGAGVDVEGGLATVYSFVNLAILRVGLEPVPGEAVATPKDGHCSTFEAAGSEMAEAKPSSYARRTAGGGCPHIIIFKIPHISIFKLDRIVTFGAGARL
jgi:hypothetical protein